MYRIVKYSFLPLAFVFLLLVVLTVILWWKKAINRRWLFCLAMIVVLLYVVSTPVTARLLIGSLEWPYLTQSSTPDHADAMVVLGGGSRYYGPDHVPPYVADDASICRALHAAEIYRPLGGCPIIVSGNDYHNREESEPVLAAADPLESNGMSRVLLDLGVQPDDIILEEVSRDTYENIVESKKLIQQKGFKDVILVTDAAHMRRAELCCKKLGLEVTPAPCNYYARAMELRAGHFFPNYIGVFQSQYAVREYLGMVWYWLKGRI